MRTDSTSLSQEAVAALRETIVQRYGQDKLPDKPHQYRTRAKNAQEAHEAVRPTDPARLPDSVKSHLSEDQHRLYELVWKRAVACQMKPALIDTVAVDLGCGTDDSFRATGSRIADPGFMAVYLEGTDDGAEAETGDRLLPAMEEGDEVVLRAIRPEQHFTEPPPRYSEASLVRALEEMGIGRPSTYAAIISTLQQRNYVLLDNRRFKPTDTGRVVAKFLTEHFDRYVDYDFTARLEDDLDAISRGERDWKPLLEEFWEPFHQRVEEKKESVSRGDVVKARELGTDPKSGRKVVARLGRFGPFVQLGTKDDEEKPRFAGLKTGQSIDTITLDEAMGLFQLPRDLGTTPEGEEISVNIGRYGPYVRFGSRFASLKKDDDPYTIGRERALELIAEKKESEEKRTLRRFDGSDIRILRGRFGPYITDGKVNARIPKDQDAESLDLAACQQLIEEAASKTGKKAAGGKSAGKGSRSAKSSGTGKRSTAAAKGTGGRRSGASAK